MGVKIDINTIRRIMAVTFEGKILCKIYSPMQEKRRLQNKV